MSLNCLKTLKRTDSDLHVGDTMYHEKANINRFLARVERSWSGNLGKPIYGKMRSGSNLMADKEKEKEEDRYRTRHHSSPSAFDHIASPRLVRSSGMRRDWSFEDLRRGVQGY